MTLALIIGLSLGFISILFSRLLKQLDEKAFYGLMLTAIGALYVGFTWTDTTSFIINCIQCFFFGTLAYLGIKKNAYLLAAGFILHGAFDFVYGLFPIPDLRPPHYDVFCLSIDWIIGVYLFIIVYGQMNVKTKNFN
ncbi:hypothetical protein FRZ67_02005 [Panacibacter ginsenosidivorans]|uniref:CPBP family intramembrane metalloprotease n=1 Tax=Panacibacter ginsenosidivorans TaxID=1813871 RepID=A0A5B8V665_9BACT|nr:DUF6010 family protein [Panacibacter ginsenosidivorans]QEC66136.1 hypothetical protein FRZ67_02005 [Panacibacter ginsenosidivorans]